MNNKNTLFVGKVFQHFPSLKSTNLYALDLLAKSKPIEGTVISTLNQTAGRGQIGSSWVAVPGKNITLSCIFYPKFLAIQQQFQLNLAFSLAVYDFITSYIENEVKVKWPNDIYVDGRKISGILIQNAVIGNQIKSSVVGIGINVNQTKFPEGIGNPISLKLAAFRDWDLDGLIQDLCYYLETRYLELKKGGAAQLKRKYLELLYKKDQQSTFYLNDGTSLTGMIKGIDDFGRLEIKNNITGKTDTFALKEISFS